MFNKFLRKLASCLFVKDTEPLQPITTEQETKKTKHPYPFLFQYMDNINHGKKEIFYREPIAQKERAVERELPYISNIEFDRIDTFELGPFGPQVTTFSPRVRAVERDLQYFTPKESVDFSQMQFTGCLLELDNSCREKIIIVKSSKELEETIMSFNKRQPHFVTIRYPALKLVIHLYYISVTMSVIYDPFYYPDKQPPVNPSRYSFSALLSFVEKERPIKEIAVSIVEVVSLVKNNSFEQECSYFVKESHVRFKLQDDLQFRVKDYYVVLRDCKELLDYLYTLPNVEEITLAELRQQSSLPESVRHYVKDKDVYVKRAFSDIYTISGRIEQYRGYAQLLKGLEEHPDA